MTAPPAHLREALEGLYRFERELGRGATATVFLAHDLRHDRRVAIKVLRPELAAREPERFLREIRIAAQLTHPQILSLHDSGEHDGALYYVMPFLEGESLRHRLNRERTLPIKDALDIAADVAAALDHAHRRGVLHRDIKPENILLHEGTAVVADFGVAKAVSAAAGDSDTEPGLAVGTPAYMSPEQASGERELDGRSDLYALSCVVYEMLAGRPPFAGPGPRATMAQHAVAPVPSLRSFRPEVPAGVERVLERALAKDPAHRFATTLEFSDTLRAAAHAGAPATDLRAIAVLPLVNAGPDPDAEYLSDGITDELINALTKVEGLRVASRTSVFALKGRAQDVRAIGSQLNVATVLEGTVRTAGRRLRVTAQLSETAAGRLLWSERFDRDFEDVFAIQEEIASTIVRTLRVTLLRDLGDAVPRRYTENVKAYRLYLKGRFCWNRRTPEGVTEAIEFFEQAIAEDPHYALAYSGLSDSYALQLDYRGVPVAEGMERAKSEARRALALDDSLAEAHASLAWVTFIYDWDWTAAERQYRRAIELNPRYASAHQWYAWLHVALGRFDQALAEGRAALELDPASVSIRRSHGWLHYYARRYDEALEHVLRAIAMNPTAEESHRILGMTYAQLGRHQDAIEAFREAVSLTDETSYATSGLGYALARAGRRAEAERELAELEARARSRYVSPVAFVRLHLGLGDPGQALEWLERARAERRGFLTYLAVEPLLDPLRPDPRFARLLEVMRLPKEVALVARGAPV